MRDGKHKFYLIAEDLFGNKAPSTTKTWTLDTVAPVITFTQAPNNTGGSVRFTWRSTEEASFECSLDNGTYTPCGKGKGGKWIRFNLRNGPHIIYLRGRDDAGNVGTSVMHRWTVDITPPKVTISEPVPFPSRTNVRVIKIRWYANEKAVYRCAVDDIKKAVNCGSRTQGLWKTPVLKDGKHFFYLISEDIVGNKATTITRTWTLDTVAPVITFSQAANKTSGSARFIWRSTEEASFECLLDSGNYTSCGKGKVRKWSRDNLPSGVHVLYVRGKDDAGNVGAPVIHRWTVERPCDRDPCANKKKCENEGDEYRCICLNGWTGAKCEKRYGIARCSSTGDPHYKTFDGKRYDFMGKCQYVLAKHSKNKFEVLQHNEACAWNKRVSCTKAITIKVGDLEIYAARGGDVTVGEEIVQSSIERKGVSIEKKGRAVSISSKRSGWKVIYNGVYNVHVEIISEYKGQVTGLCGNYNGNQADDFTLPNGTVTGSYLQFGNSWKGDNCPDETVIPLPTCGSPVKQNETEKRCSLLKTMHSFKRCNDLLNPDAYINNCIYDVCSCRNQSSCICQAFEAYSEDCMDIGANPSNWKKKFRECTLPCSSAPCFNGGQCQNKGRSYVCICSEGYTGSQCERAICISAKLDLVYVVDGSGSVNKANFKKMLKFIRRLNTRLNIGPTMTHVGLVQFGLETKVEFDLGPPNTLAYVNKKVNKVNYLNSGDTFTGSALNRARTGIFSKANRPDAQDVLILLTDGVASQNDDKDQLEEASQLRKDGVKIITIGVGVPKGRNNQVMQDLTKIAGHKDQTFKIDFKNLNSISDPLIQGSCSRSTIH